MDAQLLKVVGQITGIGGIALGILLLVFREVLRKNIFPDFTREQGYRTIRLVLLLTFLIAALGIGAWAWVSVHSGPVVSESNAVIYMPQQAYPVFEPIHRRDTGVFERDVKPTP